ncbi:ricin-type beta-trefoil lectin domain protein [Kitasatospora sp. NPDC006697]|uniref:ricin-type beta-trefoil lectin domain protein n=1 Tax=Kitasatospora sp. NPDC006697 TaxID=3364020 RepID=UPI00368F5AA3
MSTGTRGPSAQVRTKSTGRALRAAAVIVASTLGLTLPSLDLAHAQTGAPVNSAAPQATGQAPALTGLAKEINDARTRAKATGQQAVIDSLTTESSMTWAKPDGTLTTDTAAQPVRTKHGNGWQDIDATLRRNADGTLSPVNTPAQVVFSAGGDGPLATATTPDGKKLTLGSPFRLPAPTVTGDSALYTGVLKDVDLRITALPTGGWREVLVVNTAAAAASPQLAKLHFPVSTSGLDLSADASGSLVLKDAAGKVRMHAPTPFQWDSGRAATPPVRTAQPRFAAPEADRPATSGSTAEGPGDDAAVGTIGLAADAGGIDLTPDQSKLGKGTGPWYLDPTVSVDGGSQISLQVQEYHAGTSYVNTLSSYGTGFCGYSDCTGRGRERAYFQLAVPGQLTTRDASHGNPVVHDATLYAQVASSSSPGTTAPMGLYSVGTTGAIGGGTNWNNQPCKDGMSGCSKVASTNVTGASPFQYDVTWWMQQAVNNQWGGWTVAFAPDDENNMYYREHISNNVHLTTNYDIAPTIWYPRTTPTPGFADTKAYSDCQTAGAPYAWYNPGWVGANQNITLNASTWSPIGAGLDMNFHLWDDNDSGFTFQHDTGYGGAYQSMSINAGSLTDGHQYGWSANSTDGWLGSGDTPWCYFRVDKTAPTLNVTSGDFPPTGTLNATPKVKAGQTGNFTVTGTDPAPASGSASGLACFTWSSGTISTGWHCGDANTVNANADGTASFPYKPQFWGTNVVYVQAQDRAGNYSQPFTYSFYAPWDPATATPVPGNLTGDGRADILLPDAAGNLTVVPTGTDPAVTRAAPLGLAPQDPTSGTTTTWNDVQTTHRGALRSVGVDDVFGYTKKTPVLAKNLYLYPNVGNGTFRTAVPVTKPTSWVDLSGNSISRPADFTGDWSKTTQILALGALTAPLGAYDGDITEKQTSLLAVENGNLWLYRSASVDHLDADAVEVSTTGNAGPASSNPKNWENFDLIGPGSASGTGLPTLWTRNRTDGTIHAYPVKVTNGKLDLSALADPSTGYIANTGGVTPASYPVIGSAGDLNGDGLPDLYAVDGHGQLVYWTGGTADGTAATALTGFTGNGSMGYPGGSLTLYTALNGTSCMDAFGSGNGSMVSLYGCWQGANEHYHFFGDGTLRNQGHCVAASGGGTANNTAVILWDCLGSGHGEQQWVMQANGSLLNPASGRCLDVPNGNPANGVQLQLYDCNGSPAQKWLPSVNPAG